MSDSFFQKTPIMVLLVVALFVAAFLLNVAGLWIFVPIPAGVVGFFLRPRAKSLLFIGLPCLVATLISIIYLQPAYKLTEAGLIGSIAGIPGGGITFLILTVIISFAIGSLSGMVGSYANDLFLPSESD